MSDIATRAEPATLTVEQAAALLGVSRGTAYNAVKAGEIPTVRIGRRVLVPRQRLDAMLAGEAQEAHDR
jgi:excisionase family DNA binding protein